MNIIKWLEKEIKAEPERMFIRLKTNFIIYPISIIVFFGLYQLVLRETINGGTVLLIYFSVMILITLTQVWKYRDNPNASIYYLVNPSRFSSVSKIILIVGTLFFIAFALVIRWCGSTYPLLTVGECVSSVIIK